MNKILIKWILCFFLTILVTHVKSHQLSTAFLNINESQNGLKTGDLYLPLNDLAKVIAFDENFDGEVTWGEIKKQKTPINNWVSKHLTFNEEPTCVSQFNSPMELDRRFDSFFLVIKQHIICSNNTLNQIKYTGFLGLISTHKLLINDHRSDVQLTGIIDHDQIEFVYPEPGKNSAWNTIKSFTYQGVVHILIGLDHVVFLMCLLLSVFLTYTAPTTQRKMTQIKAILIGISLFTLAHSITLLLVAIGWLIVSFAWVEWFIALTILFTAINNVFPVTQRIYSLILIFGLIHGMGFANVLIELGVPQSNQVMSVFSFNLGVELGQLLLVSLTIPIFFLIQAHIKFSKKLFQGLSLFAGGLALYWMIVRF